MQQVNSLILFWFGMVNIHDRIGKVQDCKNHNSKNQIVLCGRYKEIVKN
jgi:hypothetical protein